MKSKLMALLFCVAMVGTPASAATIFFDGFDTTADPLWGNEVGNWSAGGGVYDAASPSNAPITYSSLPFDLTDFTIELDINSVRDGGVWLRSQDNQNGILLVTGGGLGGNNDLYFHRVIGGSFSGPLLVAFDQFTAGDDIHLRIEVTGNSYYVFLNNSATAATSLTDTNFASGKVALYDFSDQTFDNVSLSVESIPAPAALPAGLVLMGIAALRRRRNA